MKARITEGQYKNILKEDVSLAKKLLADRGISEDNHFYIKAKEFLLKNNAVGYLGYAVFTSLAKERILP